MRDLVKSGVSERGRQQKGFETRAAAARERKHRVAVLRRLGPPFSALGDLLNSCRRHHRCGSMACPICARGRRRKSVAAMLAFLAGIPIAELSFVTLICSDDALAAGKLASFDPKKLIARTRRQLDRAGVARTPGSFLIGYIDGEWDEGWNVYQPHLHLIVRGVARADLDRTSAGAEKLSRTRASRSRGPTVKHRVRAPVRQEDVFDDIPRLALYLDKGFWPSVARAGNPNGIPAHAKRRLKPLLEGEQLLWMNTQKPASLRLYYGVKITGQRLKFTRRVHTQCVSINQQASRIL